MKTTEVFNQTDIHLDDIRKLPVLATCKSLWRQRNITLYQCPNNPEDVISVGVTFDGSMIVACREPKSQWRTTIERSPFVME